MSRDILLNFVRITAHID